MANGNISRDDADEIRLRKRIALWMSLAFVIPTIAIIFLSIMVWRLSAQLAEVRVIARLSAIETQYRPLKNFGYAISEYQALVDEMRHPLARMRLAQVATAAGEYALARRAIEEANDQPSWQLAGTLAYLNWAEGLPRDAIRYGEMAIEKNPCDVESLNIVAWISASTEGSTIVDLEKAETYAKKAVECSRGMNSEFLDTLAEVYIKEGKLELAAEQIRKAVEVEEGLERYLERRLDELEQKAGDDEKR